MKEKDIVTLINEMEKSALAEWNKGNPSGYLDIYSQDITYFDPFHEKRIDSFENMRILYENLRGKIVVDRYEIIDPNVQLSGNMAVLSYNFNSYCGNDIYKWNCTEVYKLHPDNVWKIIHNHWSLIQSPTQ